MNSFMTADFSVKEVTMTGFVLPGTGRKQHKNRTFHGIVLNLGVDKDYIFSDGQRIRVGQNEIIYLPKGSTYEVQTKRSGRCYFINFELSDPVSFPPFSFHVKHLSEYLPLFRNAADAFKYKKRAYAMQAKTALYQVLIRMQTDYESKYQPSKTAAVLAPAIEAIHRDYTTEDLPVAKLASLCGISEDYLRKLFHAAFGVSPRKYVNQLKLRYAGELIASGMYSVTDTAILAGFADVSYFSREFRKAFGVSPAAYKKEMTRS